jgi:hypothetical protein
MRIFPIEPMDPFCVIDLRFAHFPRRPSRLKNLRIGDRCGLASKSLGDVIHGKGDWGRTAQTKNPRRYGQGFVAVWLSRDSDQTWTAAPFPFVRTRCRRSLMAPSMVALG